MKIIRWFFAAMLFVVFPTCGYTQDWPTHVIRVIVPFPAGGSGDVRAGRQPCAELRVGKGTATTESTRRSAVLRQYTCSGLAA